ncbi:diaminohydroxyphosphoribosylaminopyrimidine deaminase [Mycobacteroides abscessus subsp. massiliense]|nr:diaminohydroxyphosphoribosylaminopyrimidine deaminase [Mycobacteroides abscessus subsp. massiliense]
MDPSTPLFNESEVAPIVVTSASGAPHVASRVPGAQILVSGDGDTVDLPAALATLHARGLSRVLCEGGPALLGTLLSAHLVDELCLTIAPTTIGGAGLRITSRPLSTSPRWICRGKTAPVRCSPTPTSPPRPPSRSSARSTRPRWTRSTARQAA